MRTLWCGVASGRLVSQKAESKTALFLLQGRDRETPNSCPKPITKMDTQCKVLYTKE